MKRRPPFEDPFKLMHRGLTKINSLWRSWSFPFDSIGRKASFAITSTVSRSRAPRIRLGNSVSLREHAWLNVAVEDPAGEPVIVIEDNCTIGFGCVLSAKNRIHLERDIILAQVVLIMDHNHAYEDVTASIVDQGISEGGTIRIGQGTWIGHGACIICPRGELVIGRNSVIAANAVVTRSVPPYSVLAGNPAKVIKQFDTSTNSWAIGSVHTSQASQLTEPASNRTHLL